MGLVIPNGEANLDDPIFSYYAPFNLLGSASGTVGAYSCACERDRFSTAGTVGARRFSMTAFPDGTTMLVDRGDGSTFTYSLDDIPGLTGPRPIWSASGAGLGDLGGGWMNAADRLGMIVRGGPGMRAALVPGANRTILLTGATGTGSGNRGAMLLPLVDHATTAALDAFVTQPATPSEWSALSGRAADGSVRLAVARWGGPIDAALEIGDPRGAPIPDAAATLDGTVARFTMGLEAPASRGQTANLFALASAPIRGQQAGEQSATLANPNSASVTVRVTKVVPDAEPRAVERVLVPGERVLARTAGDWFSLAGPELEPLIAVQDRLEGLIAELEGSCRRSPRRCRDIDPILDRARDAFGRVTRAIDEATDERPDPSTIAAETLATELEVEQLLQACKSRSTLPECRSVEGAGERMISNLHQAQAAFSVTTWIDAGNAQPGEPLNVRVFVSNWSARTVYAGSITVSGLGVPRTRAAFTTLPAGSSRRVDLTLTAPADTVPGTSVRLHAEIAYRSGPDTLSASADGSVFVSPLFELTPDTTRLRLAAGGANLVSVRLVNRATRALPVTLVAAAPDGAAAVPSTQTTTLAPLGSANVLVALSGVGRTTGSAPLALTATTETGVAQYVPIDVRFTDNLALNDVGAPWPKASATSNQAPFPPSLAFNGNTADFWVSDGVNAGQGPSPANPKMLNVDFGAPARIGAVVMVPRVNYGPRGYSIEISNDGVTWTRIVDVPNSPNATVTSTFPPVTTRLVRLNIIGGHDRIQPPRNVQVAELIVHAAP